LTAFVAVSASIQIGRLLSLSNYALDSYKEVDCAYSVFKNSVLNGFKDNTDFETVPFKRKFLGLNGYRHFAETVKKNLANIRPLGGFSASDIYTDSQALYTQIIDLRNIMFDRKLLSCTQANTEIPADFSENGPNGGLAFGSLLEINNIANAAR
jgi:hypothetical protein